MFFLLIATFALVGQQCLAIEKFDMSERSKQQIVKEKDVGTLLSKGVEYWSKNPVTLRQKECFSKMKPGESIDFVIDLAPSPQLDEIDRRSANAPVGQYLELSKSVKSASKSYFDSVQNFIDAVTFELPVERTYSVIYNDGDKFFIRGRPIDVDKLKEHGDFKDQNRNLLTMWPVPTDSRPDDSVLLSSLKNNLGRMTKLALWNRNNGIPTVLEGSSRSKPIYTVVITDGYSGAKLNDLTDDLRRTTIIDVGEQRFLSKLPWDEMKELASVYTIMSPQELPTLISSVRNLGCRFVTKFEEQEED